MKPFLISLVLLICLAAISCQGIADDEILIKDLETDPSYTFLSLTEVEWELIGYGNDGNNRLQLPIITTENCVYRLSILEKGEIEGRTCPNIFFGIYSLTDSEQGAIVIENFVVGTEALETFDPHYFDRMNRVYRYQLTSIGLKLYYKGDNFMLFTPH
ncbi:hypothetical protein [Arthrospiribacter ruber]|uniref:META domain-containing protein n=1 Tax=Arthrospiribacter ruber TaxID=2487934 RepID=A0A951MFN5_9BACT|nr:hypothetical protein [Arthrospiribacter ruber]MBW3469105.1 hypothetical protein [Arthrospiribacter ruber]